VHLLADLMAAVAERMGPVWQAYREAAATDARAAADMVELLRARHESLGRALELLPGDSLRLPLAEAVDSFWAISSLDGYLLLTGQRGWSHQKWHAWLRATAVVQLLAAPTRAALTSES
jgi:hypothetical protein